MTATEKDKLFLSHILESIKLIEEFLIGFDKEKFQTTIETQYAVIRCFEIIGEAFNNLSAGFRQKHKEVAWREAIDMRNTMIHDYFEIDLDVVWYTTKNDLPKMEKQIKKIIKEF